MTKYLFLILLVLISTAANAQQVCVFEYCDTRLPKAGEKVIGKDNCGATCITV